MPTFVTVRPDVTVEVVGADRLTYLEAVTTQHLVDQKGRTVVAALELTAQGSPVSQFDVLLLEDRALLVAPTAAVADDLVGRLGARTFLSDATFSPADVTVVSLRGDEAEAVALSADLEVAPGRVEPRLGSLVARHRTGGTDVLVDPGEVPQVVAQLTEAGAQVGDAAMFEAWQIASGVPRWGHEVIAPHLPEELGLLPSHVHLAKGCYPGQEAVGRMWMLGRPRRRLARIEVAAGQVAAGWVAGEGRGRVEVTGTTTWGGRDVGMAFVPDGTQRGDVIEGDGATLRVLEVVGASDRVPGHDPAVTRRRDRRGA